MIKKCLGCGINLQTKDKEKEGYTEDLNNEICERCFKLKNYGEYKEVSLTNETYKQILSEINCEAYNPNAKEKSFFVADEGGYANPFAVDMFDSEGWLEGHENEEGYNIEEACRIADKMNG